jgi:dynein heavy chain
MIKNSSFSSLHEKFETGIHREGKRIHYLMANSFNAAGISEASPAWQEYIGFINDIILKGFKMSSFKSLTNMQKAMISSEVLI